MIRFGPAGWDYKDWYGTVYPSPKPRGFDPLAYLVQYVSFIEINSSFYGPPTPTTAAKWRDAVRSKPEFRFTAKLWQRFTHERDTAWTNDEVDQVRQGFDVLHEAGRLGAVLLQFPWSFRNNEPNREWLRDLIATFGTYKLVLEVRHASWNVADVYQELSEAGVGIANIDQPLFKNSIAPAAKATSAVAYVRVHGRNYVDWFRIPAADATQAAVLESRNAKFNYLYSVEELVPWVERIQTINALPEVKDTFVATNNHYEGKAMANLIQLEALVMGQPVDPPPTLAHAYPDAVRNFIRQPPEGVGVVPPPKPPAPEQAGPTS